MIRQPKQQQNTRFFRLSLTLAALLASSSAAYGQSITLPTTRISAAGDKFDGVVQVAAVFEISRRTFLRSHHIELAIGPTTSSGGNAVFASVGPVWRTPLIRDRLYVDVGIAPTLFSASSLGGRELGGHFHFTSFASMGVRVGRSSSLALRVQHTSNGGLRETNPGMDMIGLELSLRFSD